MQAFRLPKRVCDRRRQAPHAAAVQVLCAGGDAEMFTRSLPSVLLFVECGLRASRDNGLSASSITSRRRDAARSAMLATCGMATRMAPMAATSPTEATRPAAEERPALVC